jgi:hypothetical protein
VAFEPCDQPVVIDPLRYGIVLSYQRSELLNFAEGTCSVMDWGLLITMGSLLWGLFSGMASKIPDVVWSRVFDFSGTTLAHRRARADGFGPDHDERARAAAALALEGRAARGCRPYPNAVTVK